MTNVLFKDNLLPALKGYLPFKELGKRHLKGKWNTVIIK